MSPVAKSLRQAAAGGRKCSSVEPEEAPQLKEIYLHPGQTFVTKEPSCISMILGSCVGVCLFGRRRKMGGATHYMLPKWDGTGEASSRYGDVALHSLIEQFQSHGSSLRDIQAMVFGGASMFQAFRAGSGTNVGKRNADMAEEILSQYSIAIVRKSLGGESGRKLKMRTDIGTVSTVLVGN